MAEANDDRMLGILRAALLCLVGEDPDAAPVQDEQGGCVFCGASGGRGELSQPKEADHSPDCGWAVGHLALRATVEPAWVTGVREDEAREVVGLARQMAGPDDYVDWLDLYRALSERQRSHVGWDGLVRQLEDQRLTALTAELSGSGKRFHIDRLRAELGASA